jgi:hypothetical protein
MSIGNRPTQTLIASCALLVLACQPQERSTERPDTPIAAWWTTIAFTPASTTVRGIDVKTIDPQWRRAEALDTVMLRTHVSVSDIRQLATSPTSFSVTADLDGDGVAEEFFVGVYEKADGQKGRFVAITRRGRPVQQFSEEGTPGFSALVRGDGEVRWYKCIECGDFETIKWSGSSYVLE